MIGTETTRVNPTFWQQGYVHDTQFQTPHVNASDICFEMLFSHAPFVSKEAQINCHELK